VRRAEFSDLTGASDREKREGLERVPHDELALRIVLRLLMEAFDRRHQLALLPDLDAVGHEDKSPRFGHRPEVRERELDPELGKSGQDQRARVEEVQEQRVDGRG